MMKFIKSLFASKDFNLADEYPYLVVRLIPGYYNFMPVKVYRDIPRVSINLNDDYVQCRFPYNFRGNLSKRCRDLLIEEVKEVSKNRSLSMCIVWKSNFCCYIEPVGSVRFSKITPTLTIRPDSSSPIKITKPSDYSSANKISNSNP
jgi:hypothetical protein